jgi:hypothetical protein
MMDEPKPFGMWNRRHVAADPRCPYSYDVLSVMLNQNQLPPLEPSMRAGGQYLYSEDTVEAWFVALEKWRADAPARAAAKKAEQDERIRRAMEREAERWRVNKLIGDTAQQGYDNLVAEMRGLDKL